MESANESRAQDVRMRYEAEDAMDGEQTLPGAAEPINEVPSSNAATDGVQSENGAPRIDSEAARPEPSNDARGTEPLDSEDAIGQAEHAAGPADAPESGRIEQQASADEGSVSQDTFDTERPNDEDESAAVGADAPQASCENPPGAHGEDRIDPNEPEAYGDETAEAPAIQPEPQPDGDPGHDGASGCGRNETDPGSMPRFLTREEYENFGDDPEPLPQGFEVIDGGPDASVPPEILEAARSAAEPQPAPSRNLAAAATEAASSVGNLIAHGVGAVREVSAAKRAHAEARGTLEELAQRIEEQSRELAYRQDVTARFADIVAEQNERKMGALRRKAQAQSERSALEARIMESKQALDQMKDADAAAEKRLKAELDSAEAHEESARESAVRMKRRLTDAERALDKAREDRKTAVEAAEHAVHAAEDRLGALRAEYAELQRNPSANSAVYSVREGELANEISDAVEGLRRANDELPRIREEVERTLDAAQTVYDQAKEPIDEAKAEFRAVSDETAAARDALETARKESAARQRELKDSLRDLERTRKQREEAEAAADAEAADADASIEQARDIHAHPEVTERIAASLAADRAEALETQDQVAQLAEAEQSVRDRTRASRMKLGLTVGAALTVVLIVILIWSALFA